MCIFIRMQQQSHVLEFLNTAHALRLLQTNYELLVSRTQSQINHSDCLESLFICIASKVVNCISSGQRLIVENKVFWVWGEGCSCICIFGLLKETFLLAHQLLILLFFNATQVVLVPLLLVQSAVFTMLIENLIVIGLIFWDNFRGVCRA